MGDGFSRGLLPWMAQGRAEDAVPRPIVPESIREHEAELGELRAENARLSTQVAQLQEEIECIADNNLAALSQSAMLRAENERQRLDLAQAKAVLRYLYGTWFANNPTFATGPMNEWGILDFIRAELAALEASDD